MSSNSEGSGDLRFDLCGVKDVGEGTYQIGPYRVTPGDDASGLMAYVVRMQAALEEAIQALHNNEVKVNQLTSQVSRLTEEKAHAVSKLNVVTRTVQERDQQWRKAQVDLENLKYEQEQQEKAGPKKVAADARKQLSETKSKLQASQKEVRELKVKVTTLEKEHSTALVKVGVLEEELELSGRRHQAMEEQRMASQEQVSALTWKLRAYEGQYSALYQQYAHHINATPSAQDHTEAPSKLPSPNIVAVDDGNLGNKETSGLLRDSTGGKPQESLPSPVTPTGAASTAPHSKTVGMSRVKGEPVQMRGVQLRRRTNPHPWIPEWSHRLRLRSTPRVRFLLVCYVLAIHVILLVWFISPSCYTIAPS